MKEHWRRRPKEEQHRRSSPLLSFSFLLLLLPSSRSCSPSPLNVSARETPASCSAPGAFLTPFSAQGYSTTARPLSTCPPSPGATNEPTSAVVSWPCAAALTPASRFHRPALAVAGAAQRQSWPPLTGWAKVSSATSRAAPRQSVRSAPTACHKPADKVLKLVS